MADKWDQSELDALGINSNYEGVMRRCISVVEAGHRQRVAAEQRIRVLGEEMAVERQRVNLLPLMVCVELAEVRKTYPAQRQAGTEMGSGWQHFVGRHLGKKVRRVQEQIGVAAWIEAVYPDLYQCFKETLAEHVEEASAKGRTGGCALFADMVMLPDPGLFSPLGDRSWNACKTAAKAWREAQEEKAKPRPVPEQPDKWGQVGLALDDPQEAEPREAGPEAAAPDKPLPLRPARPVTPEQCNRARSTLGSIEVEMAGDKKTQRVSVSERVYAAEDPARRWDGCTWLRPSARGADQDDELIDAGVEAVREQVCPALLVECTVQALARPAVARAVAQARALVLPPPGTDGPVAVLLGREAEPNRLRLAWKESGRLWLPEGQGLE